MTNLLSEVRAASQKPFYTKGPSTYTAQDKLDQMAYEALQEQVRQASKALVAGQPIIVEMNDREFKATLLRVRAYKNRHTGDAMASFVVRLADGREFTQRGWDGMSVCIIADPDATPAKPARAAPSEADYAKGARVMATWPDDGLEYPATITKRLRRGFTVRWDACGTESNVVTLRPLR